MSVSACWQAQRERLRQALDQATTLAQAAHAVRMALDRAEQGALAQLQDDVLRQQTGVLFACLKSSAAWLDTRVAAAVWKPAKRPAQRFAFWGAAALTQALLGLYCHFKGFWPGWVLALAAAGLTLAALMNERKRQGAEEDQTQIFLRVDADALLEVLDAQMRSLERYESDFGYLNELRDAGRPHDDPALLNRAQDLMEALYECGASGEEPAGEAAAGMLRLLGLRAVDYSEDSRRLFTTLPSRTETRTLSPALVSIQDNRLLRRGTAAVKNDAA